MNKVCAFTGHRQIKTEHTERLASLVYRAIIYAYEQGCRDFISGGAVGFDTLAAREVLRFRFSHPEVRLLLYLPCQNQNEHWSSRATDAYEHLLASANEVRYINEFYTTDCMRERNEAMVKAADMIIAYAGKYSSGAGQTVRLAEKMNKTVYNLYPSLERRT